MTTTIEPGFPKLQARKRKRKYIRHLAKFFFNPDTWTRTRAERMFNSQANPFEPISMDTTVFDDCIEGMKKLPAESVDLVVADPPFGIEFDGKSSAYNREPQYVIDGYSEVQTDYVDFSERWIAELRHVMKQHASAYIFSGWNNLRHVERVCEDNKLTTLNHIIWKYNFGVFTRKKFVTSHYHILLVVKSPKDYYFNKVEHYPEDVWPMNREYRPQELKNGTKLPVDLVRKCIDFSSRPGDIVLDPFMGNGTTAVAAKTKWRHFLGFEVNEQLASIIETELAQVEPGEKYSHWVRREYLRELAKEYPQVAKIYRQMKRDRVRNATNEDE